MLQHLTNRNPKKAFTIVELIIVIAVIGVLAAILIPTFANVIKKANISSAKSDVKNLNTALVTAAADSFDLNATSLSLDEAAVLLARGDSSFSMQFCTKNGLDYAWSPLYNRFAVVETSGNSVTNVLFPEEMVADFENMGASAFFSAANLVSTKTLATASTTKMDAFFEIIDDANGAPVTIQASSSADIASLAEMSSSYDQNGVGFPGVDYETDFANVTINITNDIYLGGTQWTPFGESPKKPFLGKIIGNGHTIYGLTNVGYAGGYTTTTSTARATGEAYALIAYTEGDVVIDGLNIENVNIDAESGTCVAAFVGKVNKPATGTASLTLTNCKASGVINGKYDIAGFVGKFYGQGALTFEHCVNAVDANVIYAETQASLSTTRAAGFVSYVSYGTPEMVVNVTNCVNEGNVTVRNNNTNASAYCGSIIGGASPAAPVNVNINGYKNTGRMEATASARQYAGELVGLLGGGTSTPGSIRVNLSGAIVLEGSASASTLKTGNYVTSVELCGRMIIGTTRSDTVINHTANATINGQAITGSVNAVNNAGVATTVTLQAV